MPFVAEGVPGGGSVQLRHRGNIADMDNLDANLLFTTHSKPSLAAGDLFKTPAQEIISFFLAGFFIPMASPELWQRVYAIKDKNHFKRSLFLSSVFYLIIGFILLLIGLVKRIWWGHRCWAPPRNWMPPEGGESEGQFWSGRGPWAWHHYRRHGGPPPWWGSPAEAASEDEPGEQYGPEQ